MKKTHLFLGLGAFLAATASTANASENPHYQISVGTGTAWSYAEHIEINQDNGETIDLGSVNFDTKPGATPPYYNFRVSRWVGDKALEFEFIHHKIYADKSDLENTQVSNFEVTDGYNLLYGNMASRIDQNYIVRFGAGLVVPHPDVTINGNRSHGPYQLGGVSAQLGIEREFRLNETWTIGLEGKATYSYAKIDLDGAEATVPNTAFHIVASLKYDIL